MADRILVINPNSSQACTAGIAAALAPFAADVAGWPRFEVVSLPGGPPAIETWRDWYGVAEPLCRLVENEPAAAYVIGCVSDPGVEAVRLATPRPVFGMLRAAVAAALARAERFGIVAFVDASLPRQRRVLQGMGAEAQLVASLPLNIPMEQLADPQAARARVCETARELAARGAEVVVLGCAGMAGHRAAAEDAAGIPVIEPAQAAATQALLAVLAG